MKIISVLLASGLALSLYAQNTVNKPPPSPSPPKKVKMKGVDHSQWTEVLKKHVDSYGFFNYQGLVADTSLKGVFHTYLNLLKGVTDHSYKSMSLSEQKAFLINAYNAFTVKLILDYYAENKKLPESIKKTVGWLKSPWSKEFFSLLGGKIQYLDQIEHEYLREEKGKKKQPKNKKTFHDYRVHAALNCASRSCPRLRNEAYSSDIHTLNTQLEEQMSLWIVDQKGINCSEKEPRNSFISFEEKKGVNIEIKAFVKISKIFDWFEQDFTITPEGKPTNIKEILIKYGSQETNRIVKLSKILDDDIEITQKTIETKENKIILEKLSRLVSSRVQTSVQSGSYGKLLYVAKDWDNLKYDWSLNKSCP